jgi:hypothetical protein
MGNTKNKIETEQVNRKIDIKKNMNTIKKLILNGNNILLLNSSKT